MWDRYGSWRGQISCMVFKSIRHSICVSPACLYRNKLSVSYSPEITKVRKKLLLLISRIHKGIKHFLADLAEPFFRISLLALLYTVEHRVDRVLGFFSSRPNWKPPTPSPAGECAPPPRFREEDTLACGKGDRGSQFGRGDRHTVVL